MQLQYPSADANRNRAAISSFPRDFSVFKYLKKQDFSKMRSAMQDCMAGHVSVNFASFFAGGRSRQLVFPCA